MVQEQEALRQYLLDTYEIVNGTLVRKYSYKQWKAGQKVGTIGERGYETLFVKGKRYTTHRLIFLMAYGYLPKLVDHKDQDKTNNAPDNLRDTTRSENALNISKSHRDSLTGILGVGFREDTGKWTARLRSKHLGVFNTREEAETAYVEAKLRAT